MHDHNHALSDLATTHYLIWKTEAMIPTEHHEKMTAALGWPQLLEHLARLCHTNRGQHRARTLPFLPDAGAVEHQLDLVSEAKALHDKGEPPPFGSIWDLGPALQRLAKEGTLGPETLIQMAQTLSAGARLRRFISQHAELAPTLDRLAGGIAPLDDISGPILDSFDEGGALADHASAELGRLRARRAEFHAQLAKQMRGLMEEPEISDHLQDKFYTQREDRYVLPIRTDAGSAVEGIVHGSSSSGATIFIEPKEVVGLNNQLKVAEMAVVREETRILMELSELVGMEVEAIQSNLERLERLDLIDANARLGIKLAAHRPRISRDPGIELQQMRHPLMVLNDAEVVPNDLSLAAGHAMIITGPNAGGKTVCLKTLGLCSLMLRAGMLLPVGPDSAMPFYQQVLTEMGDDQSIEESLSTFTAHLGHLMAFLKVARPGALLLLDEIAIGTDPGEGAALAQALLEAMVATGAQVVVTTHYERLKSLAVSDSQFTNASVGFDMNKLAPTYRLHLGLPGSSGALAVARQLGLAAHLADRAEELRDHGGHDLSNLLADLAGERTRLEREREGLARAREEAESLARQQQRELEHLRDKERRAAESEFRQALEQLKRARDELANARSLLRRPNPARLEQADRQISKAAGTIRQYEPRDQKTGRPVDADALKIGDKVLVQSLGGVGEITELPKRGKVAVRVGGIRSHVSLKDVQLPLTGGKKSVKQQKPAYHKPTPRKPPAAGPAGEQDRLVPLRTAEMTLDLRGFRVDEALSEVDKFIDRCLRDEDQVFFIIHGHGTGALRSALRTQLNASEYVELIHAAESKEGGEGVTVVWLH